MASVDWNAKISQYLKTAGTPVAGTGDLLAALGSGCQAAVERRIGRTFDTASYSEAYSGNGRARLYLRHDPIWSLASVSVNGTAYSVQTLFGATPVYPPATVVISDTQDSLELTDGSVWDDSSRLNVLVSYTAGLIGADNNEPPPDLINAVVYWAAKLYRDRDRIGISSQTIGAQVTNFTRDIPVDIASMIGGWRRPFLPV